MSRPMTLRELSIELGFNLKELQSRIPQSDGLLPLATLKDVKGETIDYATREIYFTSEKMEQMGIWACAECGTPNPEEYNRCKHCSEAKFKMKLTRLKETLKNLKNGSNA